MKKNLCIIIVIIINANLFGQGNEIFNNTKIHVVKLTTLNSTDWDSIVNRYYAKIYTPLRVEIDGIVIDSVGVRIKGNSFYPPTMGKNKYQPFRLKFGKFKDGQRFDGLKDVNLHMHDLLTNFVGYDLWRTSKLVAPRTSFAKVYFDNVYLGFYMFVDEVDKTFLKSNYGNNDGNLFKADEKMANLSWLGWDQSAYKSYKLETNETENDKSDLIVLLNSIHNTPDNTLLDSISSYLNIDAFINSLVIELYICKRDAFYDSGHNYFLYHNTATKKFEYIPWDLDNSFQVLDPFNLNFVSGSGMINNSTISKIINVPSLNSLYYQTTCQMINSSAFGEERLLKLIDDTETFLKQNSLSFNFNTGYTINQVKDFISGRKSKIEKDFNTYNFTCNYTNGIQNNAYENVFTVSPNPTSSYICINGIQKNTFKTYQIYNLVGLKEIEGNYSDIVDIRSLKAGIYILSLISNNAKNINFKIVKK